MIAEVLEQASPVFERLIVVLEAAEQAKASVKKQSVQNLEMAQQRIEKQMGLVLDEFDRSTMPLLDDLERVQRRGRAGGMPEAHARAKPALPTPISNRGVRLDPKRKKTIAETPATKRPKPLKVEPKNRGGK